MHLGNSWLNILGSFRHLGNAKLHANTILDTNFNAVLLGLKLIIICKNRMNVITILLFLRMHQRAATLGLSLFEVVICTATHKKFKANKVICVGYYGGA